MKYCENVSLASLESKAKIGKSHYNFLILKEIQMVADGMKTSKRRDCDPE